MKKKMISIMLCTILGLALVGCGASDSKETATVSPSAQKASAGNTYELTVISHDPRTSATGEFLEAWAAAVREASDRRINILVYHNAAKAGIDEAYDYVLEGNADIAWGLQSAYEDQFPVTSVFSLPMLGIENAVQGSEALWDFYNETDYMEDEYSPFHVLLLHANCESPISTVKEKITSVDDFKSMQIRANSGPSTLFVENLGAEPVSVPITSLYGSIRNQTCNAIITDWHAIRSFGFYGLCNYYLDENIGVSTYFMVMNQNSYDRLPEDLQKILDDTSAEAIQNASIWNDYEAEARKIITDVDPRAIYTLNDEEEQKLRAAADQTAKQWIEDMTEKGYDGQDIYDKALECIEEAKK